MRMVKERQVRETPDHPMDATIAANPCEIAPFRRRAPQEYVPCGVHPAAGAAGHIRVFDAPLRRMRTAAKPSLPFLGPRV
jgi:hypothetical protein